MERQYPEKKNTKIFQNLQKRRWHGQKERL